MPGTMETAQSRAQAPYPAHLTRSRRLPDGTHIVIRPIHPDDAELERAFINALSSDSRYYRLLGARRLTPQEVQHLTCIDYEREMAFIAVRATSRHTSQLGVARYVRDAAGNGAEFAIVVADAWQRKGVGTVLLSALIEHARAAGIGRLHGIRLATNEAMHKLARKFGFASSADREDATLRWVAKTLTPALPGCANAENQISVANDARSTA